MNTEKTWVVDPNFVVYAGSGYLSTGQSIMFELKNRLVSLGNWTVMGSSDGVSNYEYEGVTAGGSYGGGSTGVYDVWEDINDVRRAADGSGPGWCLLRGPLYDGFRVYLVIAMEGTSDTNSNGYMAMCGSAWELASDPIAYLPIVPDSESCDAVISRRTFFLMYSGTYTTRGYLSVCPLDGSFTFAMNLTVRTYYTGFMMCCRLDPASAPTGHLPYTIAMGSANGLSATSAYWKVPAGSYFDSGLQVSAIYTKPYRYNNISVMDTDLATVDCDGEAALFPFFISTLFSSGSSNYIQAVYGRIQDVWIAPGSLNEGDYVSSSSVYYYKCGYWMFPGDTIPVVGP